MIDVEVLLGLGIHGVMLCDQSKKTLFAENKHLRIHAILDTNHLTVSPYDLRRVQYPVKVIANNWRHIMLSK